MIPSLCIGSETHQELTSLLLDRRSLTVSGLSNETAKSLLISHLLLLLQKPGAVLCQNDEQCESIIHWLLFFEQPAFHFQFSDEPSAYDITSFVQFMLGKGLPVFSRAVWDMDLPLFTELQKNSLKIQQGKKVNFTHFFSTLIDLGYQHSDDTNLSPGEYRKVGDTVHIFPVGERNEYTICFSYEQVDTITRISGEVYEELVMFPLVWEEVAPLTRQLPQRTVLISDEQEDLVCATKPLHISLTSFPDSNEGHAHLRYLSVLKFYTLSDFVNDIRDKLVQDWSITIVSKRSEELQGVLRDESIPFLLPPESRPGSVTIVSADEDSLLPHSLQNPDLKVALITDREIFTLRREAKQKSVQRLALDFITSLQPGDFVAHMEHGIGRFEGMTTKIIDDVEREYLEITYAENDKLFVPVDQADKLSKYVVEEGVEPVLTRLGSQEWKKAVKKVSEETQRIAKELLEIYAKRAKAKGYQYPEDSERQRKFDQSFPYTETPGQMKAIEDIKRDMESGHPMDRLVCGDVGFGKTEVAMRAAFKAVQGGKQVAFLSPITILADQHYRSLLKRMEGFDIRIEMLSRFRTAQEQKVILSKLAEGKIDIIVGTHRLLQADVEFQNLGLVIIDEEQRFGVEQKERLKDMRASVDILTLTATPIPRTLNLGLHKLRDITTITTPPPGRLPIITEVRKYSDALVREAILKEINRSGQAYVLHNRVETIDAFAMKLRALIPQATFVVTHGQLKPEVLEERILDFKNKKFSVLVSSTIIENGIDLPSANTLIVNEAEKFGLSQLYQLRGRVGRGTVQAYAYLLYHSQRLKDDAKKRLRAIVEASELGSGFQISMRDLEIRGAGEILGASQSGNMQTVGVGHYLRMLKSAVEDLQSGGKSEEEDIGAAIEIILPFEALLPAYYITDEQEKISVYQKLAGSEDEAMLAEFERDLREEYGPLPLATQNLFHILQLKMTCRRSGVQRISMDSLSAKQRDVVVTLSPRVTATEIMQLLSKCPDWRIVGSTIRISEALMKKHAGSDLWLTELKNHLQFLERKKGKRKSVEKEKNH